MTEWYENHFPLRRAPDGTIRVAKLLLPRDLTAKEAERLCRFITLIPYPEERGALEGTPLEGVSCIAAAIEAEKDRP